MHRAMTMQRESAALGHRRFFLLPCQFQLRRGPPHRTCYFRLRTLPILKSSSIALPSSCPILGTLKTQEEKKKYRGPVPKKDLVGEWIFKNDGAVRILPLYVGSLSLAAILINRTVSGISPVADASSSQSRADVLTLALAVTVILTGLVWISIRPKYTSPVQLQGIECNRVEPGLPAKVAAELYWVWESLAGITCCRALVVVYGRRCFLQVGLAAESATIQGEAMEVDVCKLVQGSLCQGIWRSGKQNYLANLALYPGRSELLFLPENTQVSRDSKQLKTKLLLWQLFYSRLEKMVLWLLQGTQFEDLLKVTRDGLLLLARNWMLHCQSFILQRPKNSYK